MFKVFRPPLQVLSVTQNCTRLFKMVHKLNLEMLYWYTLISASAWVFMMMETLSKS